MVTHISLFWVVNFHFPRGLATLLTTYFEFNKKENESLHALDPISSVIWEILWLLFGQHFAFLIFVRLLF